MRKQRLLVVAVLLVGSAILASRFALPQVQLSRQVARESALESLEQQLFDRMQEYQRRHGKPPDTLQQLQPDYSRTDGATAEMLRCFRIEGFGDGSSVRRQPCAE